MMGTRPLKLWEPQILSPGRDPEGDELARARANGGSVGYNAFHGHILYSANLHAHLLIEL